VRRTVKVAESVSVIKWTAPVRALLGQKTHAFIGARIRVANNDLKADLVAECQVMS